MGTCASNEEVRYCEVHNLSSHPITLLVTDGDMPQCYNVSRASHLVNVPLEPGTIAALLVGEAKYRLDRLPANCNIADGRRVTYSNLSVTVKD